MQYVLHMANGKRQTAHGKEATRHSASVCRAPFAVLLDVVS